MELNLKIIGILLIALAAMHAFFPKQFGWKTELASLGLLSRQMMYVHTLFIALVILLMGIFCITSAHDIINTTLGKRIAIGFAIFWTTRLFVQFFGYSSELWRGKPFETIMHTLFSILWVYLSLTFFAVAFA